MFSIFKKHRSLRKSVRSVNAPIYYINEEPVYQTPSDEELFENIYSDGLEVDEMTVMKAREGNEKDLLRIGYVYFSRHTRNDYLKALDWFIKSAEKDSAEAEFRIAELYYKGQGVEKDQEKSFEWCLKAANKGHIDALNKMGWSYLEGWGVPVDKNRAIYWFTKAADQGDWIAQEQLDSLRGDDLFFSEDINVEFTDIDYALDISKEEIDLPMEVTEDKAAELKEIMLKYEKLQQELQDEKRRRDEEIAKRDEEMRDMAKAIEVLQSSMSEVTLDHVDDNIMETSENDLVVLTSPLSIDKPDLNELTSSLSIDKPDLNEKPLKSYVLYTEERSRCDAITKSNENKYCESPLEVTTDWKSDDGQDPNYDTPDEEEGEEEVGEEEVEEEEEDEEEGQDPNYDSSIEEEEEEEEEEKESFNYDSPDEDENTNTKPNIRFSTLQSRSSPKIQLTKNNTL